MKLLGEKKKKRHILIEKLNNFFILGLFVNFTEKKDIRGDQQLWNFSTDLKPNSAKNLGAQIRHFDITCYEDEQGCSGLWSGLSDSELGVRGPSVSLLEPFLGI